MGLCLYEQQEVYARRLEGRMRIDHLFAQAPPFRDDRSLAKRAQERLHVWQKEWAQGLVSACTHLVEDRV